MLFAALALVTSLGCGSAEQPATADAVQTPDAALVDEALLAELLGEAVQVEGDQVNADGLLVRLAFEPLIRGTGPASLQLVQGQGYRLGGVVEREPLWLLGLRDGDVLTLVDGQPMLAREQALRSQWLDRPSHVELTYLRGDETRVLDLRIRPGAAWQTTDPEVLARIDAARRAALELQADSSEVEEASDTPDAASELAQGLRCEPIEDDLDRCELLRSQLNQLLSNPDLLARKMRVVPAFSEGQQTGFKLYGIRASSFPRMLGFKNGDLIRSVNGRALNSLDEAMASYATLRNASEVELEIERKGQPRRLQIVFVDALAGIPAQPSD